MDKINNIKVRFSELDIYDEFETTVTDKSGKQRIYMGMKIEKQPTHNAMSLNGCHRFKLNPDTIVTPLLYKKLTMNSEEKSRRKRLLDIEHNCVNYVF